MKSLLVILIVAASLCSCSNKPDTLVDGGYDEQEMAAAIVRARSEVDAFIAELANPSGTNHAVKVPIEDDGETEHFWVTDVSYANGEFEGIIGNDPGIVENVESGQKWTAPKAEISDWLFMREGKMYGNYTMRPLLKAMPKDQAEAFREMLAEP